MPPADDPETPPHVERRVRQANAFIQGRINRRFYSERARLRSLRQELNAQLQVARDGASDQVPDAPQIAGPAEAELQAGEVGPEPVRPKPLAAKQAGGSPTEVRKHSRIGYALAVLLIFGCEAILNKKSFEIFTERNLYLWIFVAGVAAGIILLSHNLGELIKIGEERRVHGKVALITVAAVLAFLAVSTMRYYAVDNARRQTIAVLQEQLDTTTAELAGYNRRDRQLQRLRRLLPAQKTELATLQARVATDESQMASTAALLRSQSHPTGINLAQVAIPLFFAINVFLFLAATLASYRAYEPLADEVAATRRAEDRSRLRAWFRHAFAMWRYRRELRRHRRRVRRLARADRRHRKQLLSHFKKQNKDQNDTYQRARRQHEFSKQRVAVLEGLIDGVDAALAEIEKSYRAAVREVQEQYRTIIGRYWTAQNRQGGKRAFKVERRWKRESWRASRKGTAAPARPDSIPFRRPRAQSNSLSFADLEQVAPTPGTSPAFDA